MQLEIRIAESRDLDSIIDLFRECVLTVCRADYSTEQLAAWASSSENIERWQGKIKDQFFIVAIGNGTIVGFGSLQESATVDLLYVHKHFQGLGVARALLHELTTMARQSGAMELKADVSKTARGFFENSGFRVVEKKSNKRNGVVLDNFEMIRAL
jgi:putative acetyltransferase